MAPYSPEVTFTNVRMSQIESSIVQDVLIDPYTGYQTSTPSTLDSNGFNVAYGSAVPAEP